MPQIELPNPSELAHTYTELVRRQVTVKAAPAAWNPGPSPKGYVGLYEDNNKVVEGLWVSDLPLSAALGAVLMLVPPAVALAAGKAAKLPDDLLENCREIANITANNFKEKRMRLSAFLEPGAALPPPAAALLAKPARRLDVTVTIAGYIGGRLLILGGGS